MRTGRDRLAKVGLVIAGYVAAIAAGVVAAWLYDVRVAALPYDTSGETKGRNTSVVPLTCELLTPSGEMRGL